MVSLDHEARKEGKKEGRKERRKGGRKEGRKERKKEGKNTEYQFKCVCFNYTFSLTSFVFLFFRTLNFSCSVCKKDQWGKCNKRGREREREGERGVEKVIEGSERIREGTPFCSFWVCFTILITLPCLFHFYSFALSSLSLPLTIPLPLSLLLFLCGLTRKERNKNERRGCKMKQ